MGVHVLSLDTKMMIYLLFPPVTSSHILPCDRRAMVKGAETPEAPKVEAKVETNGANGANGANGHSQPSLIWEVVGGAMVALWWA